MNAPLPLSHPVHTTLPDVQATPDQRAIPIQRVGVKSVRHPVLIDCGDASPQPSVAIIDMDVGLPATVKGTHMSRFLEILAAHPAPLSMATIEAMLRAMLVRLDATSGSITMRFPYFVNKTAPVSGVQSLMDYDVTLEARCQNDMLTFVQQIQVPVTSLCPCSRDISDYGAHNQRSHVTIAAELDRALPLEALIQMAESAASCELYGLLKRPDEKYVTERAYDNPKFVEDLVRDIALLLNAHKAVVAYRVASENFESIHNHSAYACIEHDKRQQAMHAGGSPAAPRS